MSRAAAFGRYGAVPTNVYNSNSAVSADGRTVVVSLLQSDFQFVEGNLVNELKNFGNWFKGPGLKAVFAHLDWSVANCNGIVRVVVVLRQRRGSGREYLTWFARTDIVMRISHLDVQAGSFKLDRVSPIDGAVAA